MQLGLKPINSELASPSLCRSFLTFFFSLHDCTEEITFPYGGYYSSLPSVLSFYHPLERMAMCVSVCEGIKPVEVFEDGVGHMYSVSKSPLQGVKVQHRR